MRDDSTDEPNAADEPSDPAVRSATPGSPADQDAATEDLRATGDSIRSDIQRLAGVEEVKRSLDADDPEVDRLSEEAVGLATGIARQTKAERQLSDEIG
jgi:hypothetical protein